MINTGSTYDELRVRVESLVSTVALMDDATVAGVGNSYAPDEHIEYPPYDGWYNNFAHPDWGAAGMHYFNSFKSSQVY